MRARLLTIPLVAALLFSAACSDRERADADTEAREAGERVEEAAGKAGEAVEDAAGDVGDALEGAAREVREEVGDTGRAEPDTTPRR